MSAVAAKRRAAEPLDRVNEAPKKLKAGACLDKLNPVDLIHTIAVFVGEPQAGAALRRTSRTMNQTLAKNKQVTSLDLKGELDLRKYTKAIPSLDTLLDLKCKLDLLKYTKAFPNLDTLSITPANNLAMGALAQGLTENGNQRLKKLVMDAGKITDAAMLLLAPCCPSLEYFDSQGGLLTNITILTLALNCRKLKTLSVEYSPPLTHTALEYLAESCKELEVLSLPTLLSSRDAPILQLVQQCPQLRTLELPKYAPSRNARIEIAQHGRALEVLILDSCCNEMVEQLAQNALQLRVLSPYHNEPITDRAVIALANGCRRLEELSFSDTTEITDEGLIAIAQKCPHFKNLRLHTAPGVTDASILALAQHCPELTRLSLIENNRIGDAAIRQLHQKCKRLQSICLPGNRQISEATLRDIQTSLVARSG